MRQHSKTQTLVRAAVLVAVQVVLARYLSINTQLLRIRFAFITVYVAAMLYGPVWAAAVDGTADIIGALLWPTGPYVPHFTISAALSGACYGLFLHRKELKWYHAVIPVVIGNLLINTVLNTYWLKLLYGYGFLGLLPTRAWKNAIMIPVQVAAIYLLKKWLPRLDKH